MGGAEKWSGGGVSERREEERGRSGWDGGVGSKECGVLRRGNGGGLREGAASLRSFILGGGSERLRAQHRPLSATTPPPPGPPRGGWGGRSSAALPRGGPNGFQAVVGGEKAPQRRAKILRNCPKILSVASAPSPFLPPSPPPPSGSRCWRGGGGGAGTPPAFWVPFGGFWGRCDWPALFLL